MVGHPKHVAKALAQGVDVICAQGGEGGGHTGDTPFSVLIPAVVDLCREARSPLTGAPVIVVAAGGIADGRGLAAALAYGAAGVWVGTRFVASAEAGAPKIHKELVLSAGYDDISRTLIYSGRPMHVRKTAYVASWEDKRQQEIRELTSQGKIPNEVELEKHPEKSIESRMCTLPELYVPANLSLFPRRAHGQGCWFYQRYQAIKGNVRYFAYAEAICPDPCILVSMNLWTQRRRACRVRTASL